MSFFRMSTATANLTPRHARVCGRNQPITCEPANRDFENPTREEQGGDWFVFSVWQADWLTSIHASCLTTVVYQNVCMFVCLSECIWDSDRVRLYLCLCVRLCVCVRVSGMAPGYAVKMIKMSLLLCLVTFCLFRLYLRPLWSSLIFYYLLLSDYWPSCYLLYKEPTLISSPPPLPELKGQFTCNSSNPQSGFYWILLHFLTFILLQRNTLVSVWNLLVFWCFKCHVTFIWCERDWSPQP